MEPGGMERARRDIARGPVVPLRQLGSSFASLPMSAVLSAYAGSALAVGDIIDRAGAPRLMGLIKDLGAGAEFGPAFLAWVQMPFADFEREWLERIRASRPPG
jgi:hypothetical protein